MKKKVLILILIMLLLPSLSVQYIFAADIDLESKTASRIIVPEQDELLNCYQLVENTTKQYYNAEQKREETVFDDAFLYRSLNTYVQKKLEVSRAVLSIESEELQESLVGNYFSSTCSLDEYEFREDGLFIKLYINAEVRYPDSDDSYYFGRVVDSLVVKENDQFKISDIVFYDDSTTYTPALYAGRWDLQNNSTAVNEELNKVNEDIILSKDRCENIEEYLAEYEAKTELEIAQIETSKSNAVIQENKDIENDNAYAARAATYSFDTIAMRDYAIATAGQYSSSADNKLYYYGCDYSGSARGSSAAPYYYDFSTIANMYDCTNFASHVLLAGGANMKNNGVSAPNKTNGGGWYFNNMNRPCTTSRSESWAGVNAFGTFLLYNTGSGPRGAQYSVTSMHPVLGSIVQWKYIDGYYGHPNYGHTMIITGYYLVNPTPTGPALLPIAYKPN